MKKVLFTMLALALVLGLTLPAAMVTASPAPAIKGLWHFDTDANDSSGNVNNGTLVGDAHLDTGYFGNAVSLDGSGDYVTVADSASLDISGAITVEAWVNVSSYTSGKVYTIAGKWDDIGGNYRAYLLALSTKETGSPLPKFYISSNGTNFDSAVSPDSLSTGTWYHLAGTFDGDVLKIYVDGVQKGSKDTTLTSVVLNTQPLLMGGDRAGGSGGNAFFNGYIDEVRIWNSVPSDFEVSAVPMSDYNGVTLEHEITATVAPVAPGVTVGLEVTAGPNDDATDEGMTDINGQVTLSYTSNGTAGTDTIRIWVDRNWNGTYQSDVDYATTVTKGWVELDTLEPLEAFNPVDTQHEVVATVDPVAEDVTVWFQVYGDNPTSGSDKFALTEADGEAHFSYSGTHAGTDTIIAYFDTDGSGHFDAGEPMVGPVTKYWLEPFVTGGGNIKNSKGKPAYTFGGNVGLLGNESTSVVGQFQIVDHANKVSYHCNNAFTSLVFSGGPTESPPAHWDVATFTGTFIGNDGSTKTVTVRIEDLGEPGAGVDKIQLSGDLVQAPTLISGGNFQVHDMED
jgi:hypothetical protein